MAQQEESGFVPGPLDELFPGLRTPSQRWPALPVHPRVLEASHGDGTHTLVLASFAPAANVRAFHAALKPMVEAALLCELSRPVDEQRERASALRALELYAFAEHPFDARPALAPFGLTEAPLRDARTVNTLALLRREAARVEPAPADEPRVRYLARAAPRNEPLCAQLADALRSQCSGPFGSEPGALAQRMCQFLNDRGYAGVAPTREGIERLEKLILQDAPHVLRWLDPVVFQALCDLVAVTAHSTWGLEVDWGVCEPDEETGVAPPPLIRVHREGDPVHIPLGEHVLRWCVMPTQPGEDVPSLGAWAEHEFS